MPDVFVSYITTDLANRVHSAKQQGAEVIAALVVGVRAPGHAQEQERSRARRRRRTSSWRDW